MRAVCSTFFKSFDLLWEFPAGPSLACLPSFNAARKPSPPVRETSSPRCVYLGELFMFRASKACRSVVNSSMDGVWDIQGGAGRRRAKDTGCALDFTCHWSEIQRGNDGERQRGDRNTLLAGESLYHLPKHITTPNTNTSPLLYPPRSAGIHAVKDHYWIA